LRPDLVICLDLDIETGLRRKLYDRQEGRGEWNRMDQLEIAFHRRVRQGYLEMAQEDPDHWLVIDATQPIGVIHSIVRQRVALLLEQSPRCRARSSRKRLERG
jgi:dTMP kinase